MIFSERLVTAECNHWALSRRGRTRALLVCAALVILAGGCHRETATDTPAADNGESHGAATPGAGSSTTPGQAAGAHDGSSANLVEPGPPPQFIGYEILTTQFPDKTPQTRRRIKRFSDNSSKNDGAFTEWYPNGRVFMEGQFVAGLKQGDWKLSYDNGKPRRTEHYVDGRLDGAWTAWRDDGTRERDVSFKGGQRDGRWVTYDATGKQKLTSEEYKANQRDGAWQVWYPSGKLQAQQHYRSGQLDGVQTYWYENGKKRSEQNFAMGDAHGKQLDWDPDGKVRERSFDHGVDVTTKSPAGK